MVEKRFGVGALTDKEMELLAEFIETVERKFNHVIEPSCPLRRLSR